MNFGYCEICNKYTSLFYFELASYESSNEQQGYIYSNTGQQISNQKHRSLMVCNRCINGLLNLRNNITSSNLMNNF